VRRAALAAALLLALAARPASGQVLIGMLAGGALSSERFNIGFDIGMSFSTLTGLGDAERKTAALFGLFADWRFSERLHLGVGLIPISGAGAAGLAPRPIGDPALDSLVAGGTMTRSLGTVDIPVVLRFAPKPLTGPRIGVGGQLSFVTGATDRYEATGPTGVPVVIEEDIGDRIAGVDAGLALDLEWRWSLLAIGVRYYHGLTDLGLGAGGAPSHSRVLSGSGRIPLGRRPPRPPEPDR
jgi:hypothetical protein